MAPDEVDAGSGGVPRRRGSHWRAAVVTGIVVLGTAVAVPVVYGRPKRRPGITRR